MSDLLPFIVIGLASGSVFGLAGVGLTLTFKTTGENLGFFDIRRCVAPKRQRPNAGIDEDIHFRDRSFL